jgi:chemotaxis methyl-accepting protein methylase
MELKNHFHEVVIFDVLEHAAKRVLQDLDFCILSNIMAFWEGQVKRRLIKMAYISKIKKGFIVLIVEK